MTQPRSGQPEITPRMRVAAREHPDSWLYVIDPAIDPDGEVPPWAVVGAYPVDGRGMIGETFHPNAGYRPLPVAQPQPGLERLLELVRAGECRPAALLPAVLAARLLLYSSGAKDTTVTGFPSRRHGALLVPVCTSPAHVPVAWPGWREITGRDLVPLLHGHPLVINPGGPVTALIPAHDLAGAS